MTTEQLQYELHKIDLILRPQVVFVHVDDYKEVIKATPDIRERVMVIPTNAIEKGRAVIMDRSWLES